MNGTSLLAEERNSMLQAAYYIDPVYMRPLGEPVATFGINTTRMLDAPQTADLVDVESMLTSRYDIIGRSGNVYRKNGSEDTPLSEDAEGVSHMPIAKYSMETDKFLQRYSDRDTRMLQDREKPQWQREDINTREVPYIPQATYNDTRASAKAGR